MTRDVPPLGSSRRPGSPPRPEVLEAVVAAGRRRLRREAMWSAGVAASVAGVLAGTALLGAAGDQAQVLIPASPGPGVSASPVATPEPRTAPDGATPAPLAAGAPTPAPVAQAGPGRPGEEATGTAGSVAAPRPSGGRAVTPYREKPEDVAGAAACPVDNVLTSDSPPGTELCMMIGKGPSTVQRGGTYTVELDLCNALSSDNVARLDYATGREHDLAVEGDDTGWTWSRHHTFPEGAHSRQLERGRCLEWTTSWDTRDDAGQLVKPGRYDVSASAEVNGKTQALRWTIEVTA